MPHSDDTKAAQRVPVLLVDLVSRKIMQIVYSENPEKTKEELMRNRDPALVKVSVDNYGKFT